MIKSLIRSIAIRGRNVKRWQIASGVAWGVLLALVPLGNFFWIVLLVVSLFLRHQRILSLLVMAALWLFLPLLVMPIDALGWAVLHIDALQPLFTLLYNMPFVPFTMFNNTLVAGGLAGGIILWLPVFFAVQGVLSAYRNIIAPKLRRIKKAASGGPSFPEREDAAPEAAASERGAEDAAGENDEGGEG
ncbi:MAG: TIGR03546 family protein [Treponema sp.]|jgi:uncharacterized protein (TIGR03546 family)|nr:TIGR03546 family protein [Treponema sp.]